MYRWAHIAYQSVMYAPCASPAQSYPRGALVGTAFPPGPIFQPALPQNTTTTLASPAEMASAALVTPFG
jgi:hypothetical protein